MWTNTPLGLSLWQISDIKVVFCTSSDFRFRIFSDFRYAEFWSDVPISAFANVQRTIAWRLRPLRWGICTHIGSWLIPLNPIQFLGNDFMLNRRQLMGSVSISAFALAGGKSWASEREWAEKRTVSRDSALISSAPVVQHPRSDSFGVSIAVSGLCTAWVEWGWKKDQLTEIARASHHGLISADDRVLHIRVQNDHLATKRRLYYRVVAQSLHYKNAYQLERGETHSSDVFALRLPRFQQANQTVAVINDTHENGETLQAIYRRLEALDPDIVVWNGDTCNDFNKEDQPEQILLNPLDDPKRGFAATRPLIFVPGNHDVRGVRAREAMRSLPGWPGESDLPYNQALRLGPLSMLFLDTGEDKPDAHPVFAGTANYEPYREQQGRWLEKVIGQPQFSESPFKLAFCHIPLRGKPGHNPGTTLEGFAIYSGFGAKAWMPHLRKVQCQCVVSGHTHVARFDKPSEKEPIAQMVGGGPRPSSARLILITTDDNGGVPNLRMESQTLAGEVQHHYDWQAK